MLMVWWERNKLKESSGRQIGHLGVKKEYGTCKISEMLTFPS